MARIAADYVFGTISTTGGINTSATTLDSAELTRLPAVTTPDIAAITIHDSTAGTYEIVHVTAHAAGASSATILRAQEGSAARTWSQGATWLHGPTAADFAVSGGGGTSASPFALDVATPDDHFDGTSLGAPWSLAGSYVSGDYTVHDSYLDVTTARGPGSYIYRAAPAGDFVATMRASVLGASGTTMFGIMAVDNSGNGSAAGFYNSTPNGPMAASVAAGNYNSSFGTSNGPLGTVIVGGVSCWYRMRRVGTTIYAGLSLNGRVWSPEASRTDATTFTRLGFGTFYGSVPGFQVDYFDVA